MVVQAGDGGPPAGGDAQEGGSLSIVGAVERVVPRVLGAQRLGEDWEACVDWECGSHWGLAGARVWEGVG